VKKTLVAALLAAVGVSAQANTISANVHVNAGEVEYWQFVYSDLLPPQGAVTAFTVGWTVPNFEDPQLCVFRGSVSAANLVGCDDDSGSGRNASFSFNTPLPSVGSYVIALSGYQLTLADALAGTNPDSYDFDSELRVSSTDLYGIYPTALVGGLEQISYGQAVPLPGTLLLLGAGLAGLGLVQRRRAA
jgi:hypothetical protein